MKWDNIDRMTDRAAREAEKVLTREMRKSFGRGAKLSRDGRFGDYLLTWRKTGITGGVTRDRQDIELYLFDEESRTPYEMLWNAQQALDGHAAGEVDGFSKTPLSKALLAVADNAFEQAVDENWQRAAIKAVGYDDSGYDLAGYDRDGYDRGGFDRDGIHRETGTQYGPDGYNAAGYDKDLYSREGINLITGQRRTAEPSPAPRAGIFSAVKSAFGGRNSGQASGWGDQSSFDGSTPESNGPIEVDAYDRVVDGKVQHVSGYTRDR